MNRVFGYIFTLLLLTCVCLSQAQQFSSQHWHDGFIVTAKKDTIKGKVKYNMETNAVQVKYEKIYTFSSHNTVYLKIYDNLVSNYREFYSLPFETAEGFKKRLFFELMYEGPLTLLSREQIVQETVPSTSLYASPFVRERLDYIFFFLNEKGNILQYNGRKADLFEIMKSKSAELKEFIRDNKLHTDEVRDLIRITAFYNSI